MSDASGDYAGFDEGAILTASAFEATWDLFIQPDGETAVGSASASATLASAGDVIRTKDGSPPSFVRFTTQLFSVDGSLDVTTPAGGQSLPMDGDHCSPHSSMNSNTRFGPRARSQVRWPMTPRMARSRPSSARRTTS